MTDSVKTNLPADLHVGFIGSGNMAQALLGGFLKSGLIKPENVIASAPSDRNLVTLRSLGVKTTHDNDEVISQCDLVFMCVKPHLIRNVVNNLHECNHHSPLFASIVSGVDTSKLTNMLSKVNTSPRVIRMMPNTPCMVSEGCCVYCMGEHAIESDSVMVETLLRSVGICEKVPESQVDAVCGVAGSGPAYIYAAIEALSDGGVKMGLPRQLAQRLAAQMVKGAATMVIETGKHPGQLKDEVCSPSGTTIAAMHTLEQNGLRNALITAVEASATRSKELGNN